MTPARRDLLVLCGLGRPKPPPPRTLEADLARLGFAAEPLADVIGRLRTCGLVEPKRLRATDEGKRRVRDAFRLSRVPSWLEAKRHAAMLALGLVAGSIEAQRTLDKGAGRLPAAIIARQFGIAHTTNLRTVCEALLFEKLGMPSVAVRDVRLLGHILAQRAGIEPRGKFDLEVLAARVAAAMVDARGTKKDMLVDALARQWFDDESDVETIPVATHAFDDTVRAGLARVPASGRYGDEKVFIASLWDTIARDAPAEMDLPRFKRWLLDANAKQAVVLARADLVGAMDPRQVAASEIVDRGASFHFVLDHR
jgi:hypothetical protein